ncbi:MAG: IPT/TIG domain-containing protein [Filimonas sp.]|nr:IPT/TIG domain-containing protein [Filimonas sp.]
MQATTSTVTGISPDSGNISGSGSVQIVTITGTGFNGALGVQFSGVAIPAGQYTIKNDTTITTCVLPIATAGVVDVQVNTPNGLTAISSADKYTYWSPEVTSVFPDTGPLKGTGSDQAITITGKGFTGANTVQFGSVATTNFTVVNDTTIKVAVPSVTKAATVNIQVNLPTGLTPVNKASGQYTYVSLPTITSLSIETGPNDGGIPVTITGTTFTGATNVFFGSVGQTPSTVTDTTITVTLPPGNGTVDVTVVTPTGTSLITPAGQFMYTAIPLNFSIPADVASQGVYLSMYGVLQQAYTNSYSTDIAAGTNVILTNTVNGYDYVVASAIQSGTSIPPFCCINQNEVCNFAVNIPNIYIQAARVIISVNATAPALTSISTASNLLQLPQATISVASTEGFATQGTLYICTNNGIAAVSYTSISQNEFTGCTGGSGTLLTGTIVSNEALVTPMVNDASGDVSAPTPLSQGNNIYDFFEFTYLPVVGIATLTINTSAIDQFGLPIQLNVLGGTVEPGPEVGIELSRQDVISQYATFTQGTAYTELVYPSATADPVVRILSPANQLAENPIQGLAVSNNTSADGTLNAATTYSYAVTAVVNGTEINAPAQLAQTTPSASGSVFIAWASAPGSTSYNVYRGVPGSTAITWYLASSAQPGNTYTDNGPETSGTAKTPAFDPLGNYFDDAILALFTTTNSIVLTVTDGSLPANGLQYTFTGSAKTVPGWVGEATGALNNQVIEFVCTGISNNPDNITPLIPLNAHFYVFSPFFNTNTQNPSNPSPPQWSGEPMLFANLFPTAMALGADGIFADNIQQSTALYTSLAGTTVTANGSLPASTITVASTAGFQPQGVLYIPALNMVLSYTGITATAFTGCTGGAGSITTGMEITGPLQQATISGTQTLPADTITVSATAGYPASGTLYIWSSGSFTAVQYTGLTATTFTGCTGGTGTVNEGDAVAVNNCQPAGLQQNAYSVALGSLEDALDAAILRGIALSINPVNWANAPTNLSASAGQTTTSNTNTYYYVVTTVNESGESTPSEEASYTTDNTSIQLSWAPVINAQSYNIYRGTSAGQENVLLANTTAVVFEDVLGSLSFPALTPPASGGTAPSNVQATAVTGGTLSGTYYYVVTALGYNGESMGSKEATVQTTGSTNAIQLTWDVVENSAAYKIYRATTSGSENMLVGIVQGGTTTTFTDTNANTQLPPPNIYYAPGTTSDMYAQFFHQVSVSTGGLSYADPYDDQGGQSSTLSALFPNSINVTLQPWQSS